MRRVSERDGLRLSLAALSMFAFAGEDKDTGAGIRAGEG